MSLHHTGIPATSVYWEAEYGDGTVLKEAAGGLYRQIDRSALKAFRLVAPGEILLELFVGDGRTGHNLMYRRRTMMGLGSGKPSGKSVWFLAGWVPQGPVFSIQPDTMQSHQAARLTEGAGPLGVVQPIPAEGEMWTLDELLHTSDAKLVNETIVLPTGMRISLPRPPQPPRPSAR